MGKNKNNPKTSRNGGGGEDDDEVEQLLRAAQDDVLLKLTANSHIARSSAIDSDLDRRFQALKNPKSSSSTISSPSPLPSKVTPSQTAPTNKVTVGDGDDLFARFAALKGSTTIPSNPAEIGDSSSINHNQIKDDDDDDEDDEVEKLIKWAIDAARLDPSPPSDDDDEVVSELDDDDDSDSDDADRKSKLAKGKKKK